MPRRPRPLPAPAAPRAPLRRAAMSPSFPASAAVVVETVVASVVKRSARTSTRLPIRSSSFGSCFDIASTALRSSLAVFSSPVWISAVRSRRSISLIHAASASTRSATPRSAPARDRSGAGGSLLRIGLTGAPEEDPSPFAAGAVRNRSQEGAASPRREPLRPHQGSGHAQNAYRRNERAARSLVQVTRTGQCPGCQPRIASRCSSV